MAWTFRPATPHDVDAAVPLIHSSGPAAFEYVFAHCARADAQAFLRYAFVNGAGEFGYRNHTMVCRDGVVIGAGAAYTGGGLAEILTLARQIVAHYGVAGHAVIVRGLRLEQVIRPPKTGMHYIGHLGVTPAHRSKGIGAALVERFVAEGRALGRRTAELDVSVDNPRAQALYERLGFCVTQETASSLRNAFGSVANHRRMVLPLDEPTHTDACLGS